jgi:hypothetical protein
MTRRRAEALLRKRGEARRCRRLDRQTRGRRGAGALDAHSRGGRNRHCRETAQICAGVCWAHSPPRCDTTYKSSSRFSISATGLTHDFLPAAGPD